MLQRRRSENWVSVGLALIGVLSGQAPSLGAQEAPREAVAAAATPGDVRAELEGLRAEIEVLKKQGAGPAVEARLVELERKLDVLAQELEKSRMGEAAGEEAGALEGKHGFGPAASSVYRQKRGVSIAGYGEMTYQNFSKERQDGGASGRIDELDYLRAIVYVGYKFTDKILFNSELEFEHASTGRGGSVSVEFANVDFLISEALGLRVGMVLVPMGFINELHEPPIFHGVVRPDVERNLIPSTWRENGVGVFGDAGPIRYRAYMVAGLDANGFAANNGVRGGRQSGGFSRAEDFGFTGRVDYTGVGGLLVGGSFYSGLSGQGRTLESGEEVEARATLWDLHGEFELRGLEVRALLAGASIGDAEQVNELRGLTGSASVGSKLSGAYVQVAYDLATLLDAGRWSLAPFVRYELLNTQAEVPSGFSASPANDQTILTLGLSAKPIPNVVLKLDYQSRGNEADSGVDQINVGLGYLF